MPYLDQDIDYEPAVNTEGFVAMFFLDCIGVLNLSVGQDQQSTTTVKPNTENKITATMRCTQQLRRILAPSSTRSVSLTSHDTNDSSVSWKQVSLNPSKEPISEYHQ